MTPCITKNFVCNLFAMQIMLPVIQNALSDFGNSTNLKHTLNFYRLLQIDAQNHLIKQNKQYLRKNVLAFLCSSSLQFWSFSSKS